jgi:hypothetical protein
VTKSDTETDFFCAFKKSLSGASGTPIGFSRAAVLFEGLGIVGGGQKAWPPLVPDGISLL